MRKQVIIGLNLLLCPLILFPSISHSGTKSYALDETQFENHSEIGVNKFIKLDDKQNRKKNGYIVIS